MKKLILSFLAVILLLIAFLGGYCFGREKGIEHVIHNQKVSHDLDYHYIEYNGITHYYE